MKILTVAVTALVVSLDSFMAGFSLSLNKRSSPTLPSAVALITLLLCIVTSVAGQALLRYAEKIVDYLGAALLMLLAITALFRRDDRRSALAAVSLRESIAIGVAVGMDAAIANFAFAGDGLQWITPTVFAVTHYMTVALGQILAKKVTPQHTNIFSAIILAALAVVKLL